MGSFWGHIDEGLFFILLGIWWMLTAFREYIMVQDQGQHVKPKFSYDVRIREKSFPIETMFKILFPIVGLMGELMDGGIRFQDADGNFVKLVYQQHMTIYGIFIIHGFIDLLTWFGFPSFPSLNYMSGSLSFAWYGIAFYFHSSMHGKAPVETYVHLLPVYIMLFVSMAVFLEHSWREGVWTMVIRAYGLLTLGTWFSHVSFMLYVSDTFPGGEASDLDRRDPRNVTYVKAMFGMHLFVNLVIALVLYVIVYVTLKIRFGIRIRNAKYFEDLDYLPTNKNSFTKPTTNGVSHRKHATAMASSLDRDSNDTEKLLANDDTYSDL